MKISLPGIGAVRLETRDRVLLIDAFNTINTVPDLNQGDLVLFTHTDGDHFSPEALLPVLKPDTVIVGPPAIAKPLWDSGKVDPLRVSCPYPCEYDKPERLDFGSVVLTVYNTEHFVGWHNQHVSYLVEAEGKRVYITGDSDIRPENIPELTGLDVLVASVLKEETVKCIEDRRHAAAYNLTAILDTRRILKPGRMIINHLIGCDWAADPEELKTLVAKSGLTDVIVPLSPGEEVCL